MFQYRCFISFAQRSAASTFSRRRLQLPTCCWKSIFNRPDCGDSKRLSVQSATSGFSLDNVDASAGWPLLSPALIAGRINFNTECGNVLQLYAKTEIRSFWCFTALTGFFLSAANHARFVIKNKFFQQVLCRSFS